MTKSYLLLLFPALATTLLSAAPYDEAFGYDPALIAQSEDSPVHRDPLRIRHLERNPTEDNYRSERLLLGEKSWDLFFTADYLCWKAEEGGLEYGLRSPNFSVFDPNAQFDSS